jgi:hypothetical protein
VSENPRLGWDDDKKLDELVARDVDCVHFEALDDCRWYANIHMRDGRVWQLNFGSVNSRAKGYANAEQTE